MKYRSSQQLLGQPVGQDKSGEHKKLKTMKKTLKWLSPSKFIVFRVHCISDSDSIHSVIGLPGQARLCIEVIVDGSD